MLPMIAAERVVAEDGSGEIVVHHLGGESSVHGDLLEDDLTLVVELCEGRRTTISASSSNACSRSWSRNRACTTVCSLEVAALGSAPMSSKRWAMSHDENRSDPLKISAR